MPQLVRQPVEPAKHSVRMRGVLAVAAIVGVVAGSLTLATKLDPLLRKYAPSIAQRLPARPSPAPVTPPATPTPETATPPSRPQGADRTTEQSRRSEQRQRASREQVERNSRNRKRSNTAAADAAAAATAAGLGAYAIVAEARRHIGRNPTTMAKLWCARFMNYVLGRTGYRGTGSDAALSFARYGRRVPGPRIGAIAVMHRKGGGHVGIVSGIDRHGNPILISGNTPTAMGRRIVAERVYPRRRIVAYVVPWR